MNDKQYAAFVRTAKRVKDQSKGKITMTEARKIVAHHLNRQNNAKK